nr:hypothetical protein [Marinicella sp. W31]MDC2879256.1 hypothetical protein [Marinicella sp. W31]
MTTVAKAFSALTQDVTLLVSSDQLDQASYDAAWRLGLALERAGKSVTVIALPGPGDTVDASAVDVPEALQTIPAFAGLSTGGSVTLSNAAEAGAFMLLGAPQARADVAVVSSSLSLK